MASNPQEELKKLNKKHDFFIGIDSDGCAFDTMEIKHKECFCPNFIKYWDMQNVSKYARETWEFVNLYSKTRGLNRFLALIETIKLLGQRHEVRARGTKMPDIQPLIEWTEKESKLGNPALEKYAKETADKVIEKALNWSNAVNQTVGNMVYGIAPFPYLRESLVKMQELADVIVVSQTPLEALVREWEENNIDGFVQLIAGQEHGKKSEHLDLATRDKYDKDHILMIGDAPGDLKAAETNGVLFYPINPGYEEDSWKRFHNEALDKFYEGTFKGEYQKTLINEFDTHLPERPPW
ncbi:MAG: HAD family hydrolase [Bacteroidota bacterium]